MAERPTEMMRRYVIKQAEPTSNAGSRLREPQNARADRRLSKAGNEELLKAIGGLPERTPLNPQVTGSVSRPGYRVEKIIYESQPKFFVTALLFLPDSQRFKPPYPGVLVPCGHWGVESKGHDEYQSMGALLALNGMAALVFDPIVQGERWQCLPRYGYTDTPFCHCVVGMRYPFGQDAARFEIWDGMRGIDYLQSRPEVDPKRIGCTGNSGGGTQTSYLMALDDRIARRPPVAFSPVCRDCWPR